MCFGSMPPESRGELAMVSRRPVLVGADLEEIPEPGQTRSIEIKPISFSHSRSRQIDARCQGDHPSSDTPSI